MGEGQAGAARFCGDGSVGGLAMCRPPNAISQCGRKENRGNLIVLLALFAPLLSAQTTPTDPAVEHAAVTVAHVHDTMLDPASLVLDGAYVTLPNRIADKEHKNLPTYCYAFRSHNAMGGYSQAARMRTLLTTESWW
jgi:hypothetical protein